MKKRYFLILCLAMLGVLSACGNGDAAIVLEPVDNVEPDHTEETASENGAAGAASLNNETEVSEPAEAGTTQEDTISGSDILIAYFTVPETDGVDTVSGASRVVVDGEVLGNTQYIAQLIHQSVGGDLFVIETVQEYPGFHSPLLDFAHAEKEENARPELATKIENLEGYDTIFIGYPNWNADLPMPMYTFFEAYYFSGKTIIPFTTHGGSGLSRACFETSKNCIFIERSLKITKKLNEPIKVFAILRHTIYKKMLKYEFQNML